jgi:flagellar hook protein FlgE
MFMLNDGTKNLYTRDGSYGLDGFGYLVDPASGYRVQRFGTLGEDEGDAIGFQTPGDYGIKIPFGATIPGQETDSLNISGNLDATLAGPKNEELVSINPLLAGTVPATAATLLNDLSTSVTDYVAGDVILITGSNGDGSPFSTSLAVDGTTTVGDLLSAINAVLTDATASIAGDGRLALRSDEPGPKLLGVTLENDPDNVGSVNLDRHRMMVSTSGAEGDTLDTVVELYDVRGLAHTLKLRFQKQGSNYWHLYASLNPTDGRVLGTGYAEVRFNQAGSIGRATGEGGGPAEFELEFTDLDTTQKILISIENLTQMAVASSWAIQQDGSPAGTLNTINVTTEGMLKGVATNGRVIPIAQLAIASFPNIQGLNGTGDNFYIESLASGSANVGNALSGGRGLVRGGQLEGSNVDIGLEFTRLIVAQRGFSVNARTITVANEVMEELTNVVR